MMYRRFPGGHIKKCMHLESDTASPPHSSTRLSVKRGWRICSRTRYRTNIKVFDTTAASFPLIHSITYLRPDLVVDVQDQMCCAQSATAIPRTALATSVLSQPQHRQSTLTAVAAAPVDEPAGHLHHLAIFHRLMAATLIHLRSSLSLRQESHLNHLTGQHV